MRILAILAAIAGIILGTCVVGYYGFGAVANALLAIGWGGFAIVYLYHLLLYVVLGLCWWVIVPPPRASKPWIYVASRAIRDSGSEILPLSQIGGFVMGARAATLLGVAAPVAIATTSPSLASTVFTGPRLSRRSAKVRVNLSGMCCATT